MKRPALWTAVALAALWLEVGWIPHFPGLPRPHLPLLLACGLGLVYGPRQGAAAGAIAGLWVDLWIGRLVGSSVVLYAAAGWLAGKAGESLYRDMPGLSPALGAAATLVTELARGLLVSAAAGLPVTAADLLAWPQRLWPDLVAAAVAAPLVFRLVLGVERREREARGYDAAGGSGWRGGWP